MDVSEELYEIEIPANVTRPFEDSKKKLRKGPSLPSCIVNHRKYKDYWGELLVEFTDGQRSWTYYHGALYDLRAATVDYMYGYHLNPVEHFGYKKGCRELDDDWSPSCSPAAPEAEGDPPLVNRVQNDTPLQTKNDVSDNTDQPMIGIGVDEPEHSEENVTSTISMLAAAPAYLSDNNDILPNSEV
jgi:hypothetical protein